MKVRMVDSVQGFFHGIENTNIYSVRRGDIVELEPRDVLRYLKIRLVEPVGDGPSWRKLPGVRRIAPDGPPNTGLIAALEKQIREADDEEKRNRPAALTTTRSWDGNNFIWPAD
jgi:hypothetical protein